MFLENDFSLLPMSNHALKSSTLYSSPAPLRLESRCWGKKEIHNLTIEMLDEEDEKTYERARIGV